MFLRFPFCCEERERLTNDVSAPGKMTTWSACTNAAIVVSFVKAFLSYRKTPGSWKRIVHPEGARYFFNPDKVRAWSFSSLARSSLVSLQQVFTDIDLTQQNLVEIDQCINFLREKENRVVPGLPCQETRTQLVIQLDDDASSRQWLYYFVNHGPRVVFWVNDFETTKLSAFGDLQGVTAVSHISESL